MIRLYKVSIDNTFLPCSLTIYRPKCLGNCWYSILGRTFAYQDTQFHRIGPNFMQLKINSPYRAKAHSTRIDGFMCYDNGGIFHISVLYGSIFCRFFFSHEMPGRSENALDQFYKQIVEYEGQQADWSVIGCMNF